MAIVPWDRRESPATPMIKQFNPPIQLRKNSANSTVTVTRHAFSAALDILSIFVFQLLIESLNLNFLLFLLIPFSSNTSTPKILKISRKRTIQIMSAQRNFEDIFLVLDKVNTNWAWVRSRPSVVRPRTSYLEKDIKNVVSSCFSALSALLKSICAPTERHILIARAITNKDFFSVLSHVFKPLKNGLRYLKNN